MREDPVVLGEWFSRGGPGPLSGTHLAPQRMTSASVHSFLTHRVEGQLGTRAGRKQGRGCESVRTCGQRKFVVVVQLLSRV